MQLKSVSLAFALSLSFLAGCSTLPVAEDGIPHNAVAVYSWQAEGRTIFRCAYDAEGFFWQFVGTEGTLHTDAGRHTADLTGRFDVLAGDGGLLKANIISQSEGKSSRDLKAAEFLTQPPASGILQGVRWMRRTAATGGMPLAGCSASQRGALLRVPFRARYVFYRAASEAFH